MPALGQSFDLIAAIRKVAAKAAGHRKAGQIGRARVLEQDVDRLMAQARRQGLTDEAEAAEQEGQASMMGTTMLGQMKKRLSAKDFALGNVAARIGALVADNAFVFREGVGPIGHECSGEVVENLNGLLGRLLGPLDPGRTTVRLLAVSLHAELQVLSRAFRRGEAGLQQAARMAILKHLGQFADLDPRLGVGPMTGEAMRTVPR